MQALQTPTYEGYKDSDVEWLGEIPTEWGARRLKFVVNILKRIAGQEGPDVLSITQRGIKVKDVESGEGQLAMDYSKYQFLNVGEFAMNHMDLLTGYVDISPFDGVTSPDYRVFSNFTDDVDDRYLLLIFQLGYQSKVFYRYGQGVSFLGRWRMPADNFHNFTIPLPHLEQQRTIVRFLDENTAKIDEAIAIKERQIALLKERKQIIIQNAVTKGLNPDAPMKDSGVDWIGRIPAHWEVKRLKHLLDSVAGFAFSSAAFCDEGIPVVRIGDLIANTSVDLQNCAKLPRAFESHIGRFGLSKGNLLMAMTGGTIGKISSYEETEPALLNQRVCKFVAQSDFDIEYAKMWMQTKVWQDYIDLNADGGAQPNISDKTVLKMPIPISPGKKERADILKEISLLSAQLLKLSESYSKTIGMLKEYKTTLINSAVTGKIKVL